MRFTWKFSVVALFVLGFVSCQRARPVPEGFCTQYIDAGCKICGEESSACQQMREMLDACTRERKCEEEICKESLAQLQKLPVEENRAILCP